MNRKHFETLDDWAQAAASDVAETLSADIAARGETVLAVPGGSTAQAVLPVLKTLDLDWGRIIVTLADERWVSPDHPDSNERLAHDLLGGGVTFQGLVTDAPNPEAGLSEASARIAALLPLGCVLLGMGEDGHIASLFPGQRAHDGVLQTTEFPDHPRISMTPATLCSAQRIILAVSGAEKCAVIKRGVQPGAVAELPVRHVLHQEQSPVSVLTV